MAKNIKARTQYNRPFTNYIDYLNNTIKKPDCFKYSAIDLFAGCGGLSLGFEAAGIKTYGYEMVKDCCDTYNKNLFGNCKCDKLTNDTDYPKVDIVIGGPPCQPFSVSGKQMGKDDERNGFPIFISAIKQINPEIFMFENVRGVLYKNKEYFNTVINELKALGYYVKYDVLNAVDYDVPQNRERVICIGSKKEFFFPQEKDYVVTAGEALPGIENYIPEDDPMFLTPSQDKYIENYEKKSKCITPRDLHLHLPSRTITCRNLAGATSDMQRVKLYNGKRRRLTPREAARLQSFPDWFEFCGSKESIYNQIGNAVPPFLAYNLACAIVGYLEGQDFPQKEEQISFID